MFPGFFMGGFECSTHRRRDGRRLDLLASSRHDELASADYRQLVRHGIRAARDGLRWYLIERSPGRYDWRSAVPMIRAARGAGVTVVWDLCHYGWPDDIDVWSPEFPERFAAFSAAAADVVAAEGGAPGWFCPVNEISYWAWAGAHVGLMNPSVEGRAGELKRQLVRAAIAAIDAIRVGHPEARFLFAEPAIHVDGGAGPAEHREAAENYRLSQFEAFDMLTGRMAPELGGTPDHLDVAGINYYPDNQWYLGGSTIPLGHHAYKPFRRILRETHERYRKPVVVSETGAEGTARPAWLHYVAGEVRAALAEGIPVEAVCLYPILDCRGWQNERICPVGLLSEAGADGTRSADPAFADELAYQQAILQRRAAAGDAGLRATVAEVA